MTVRTPRLPRLDTDQNAPAKPALAPLFETLSVGAKCGVSRTARLRIVRENRGVDGDGRHHPAQDAQAAGDWPGTALRRRLWRTWRSPRRYPERPPAIGAPTRRPKLMPASRACPSATCTTGPPKKYVATPNSAKPPTCRACWPPRQSTRRCLQHPRQRFPPVPSRRRGRRRARSEPRVFGLRSRSTGPNRRGRSLFGDRRRGVGPNGEAWAPAMPTERIEATRTQAHRASWSEHLQSSCRRIVHLHPSSWTKVSQDVDIENDWRATACVVRWHHRRKFVEPRGVSMTPLTDRNSARSRPRLWARSKRRKRLGVAAIRHVDVVPVRRSRARTLREHHVEALIDHGVERARPRRALVLRVLSAPAERSVHRPRLRVTLRRCIGARLDIGTALHRGHSDACSEGIRAIGATNASTFHRIGRRGSRHRTGRGNRRRGDDGRRSSGGRCRRWCCSGATGQARKTQPSGSAHRSRFAIGRRRATSTAAVHAPSEGTLNVSVGGAEKAGRWRANGCCCWWCGRCRGRSG